MCQEKLANFLQAISMSRAAHLLLKHGVALNARACNPTTPLSVLNASEVTMHTSDLLPSDILGLEPGIDER